MRPVALNVGNQLFLRVEPKKLSELLHWIRVFILPVMLAKIVEPRCALETKAVDVIH